jgi:hypothetical protein
MRFLSSCEASGEPELSLSRFATPRPDRALVSQFLLPARRGFAADQPHEKEEMTFCGREEVAAETGGNEKPLNPARGMGARLISP